MTIDLTSPDEQDWLDCQEGPPIRYSKLNEADIIDESMMEFVGPLAEALKPKLTSAKRHKFVNLEQEDYELIATALLYLVPDEQFESLLTIVQDEMTSEGWSGEEFAERYMQTVVMRFLEGIKPIRLRLIAQYLASFRKMKSDDDDEQNGPIPSSAGTTHASRFEEAMQTLYQNGIDRIELEPVRS